MRAIVLICLLHGALPFGWNVDQKSQSEDPKPGSECTTDQGSCGCCFMWKEVDRLTTYFNTTLNMLEKEYNQTKHSLDKIEGSRSAFSVALSSTPNLKCFGPFTVDKLITFKEIFINLGNGYNPSTGVFTAPHSGVYSLALTVYSDAGAPGKTLAACADLLVNGELVAGPGEKNELDQEDSVTTVVALHLKAGDKVAANLPTGCFLCDDGISYNTFSAFLLYSTE
ncbi:complement C1q-like protein 2 [Anoplopoma fimbria]|uniref:complement C1q-like protein 2 n=1 Tax=Anoplopoma fimbria TaxID=229290 RepID=UPI0023EAA7D5|nr:complement C1q-like protein 2 [Anoplopoma fimbria]